MGSLGFPELIIILVIIIMIFGANRLPEIGRGIGKGIRNFKECHPRRREARRLSSPRPARSTARPARPRPGGSPAPGPDTPAAESRTSA